MPKTSLFYQNTYLCLSSIYTMGAYAGGLLDDTHPSLENKLLKYGSFVIAAFVLCGAKSMIRQVKLDEEKRLYDLIDSIGTDPVPQNKGKDIPQV